MPIHRTTTDIGSNQGVARMLNRGLVLRLLRERGALSRSELSDLTELRSSTLTYITRDLLELGVIRESGKRASSGVGKKQQLIDINADFGCFLGVNLESGGASMVYVDAAGGLIDHDYVEMGRDLTEVPTILTERFARRSATLTRAKLLGVGVGAPGIVDPFRGLILRSTWFGAEKYPLRAVLKEAFNVPVLIDNDANLAAYAESEQGSGRDADNFVYFLVNAEPDGNRYAIHSLGATLIINGRLYRGSHFASGEIDNLIDRNGDDPINAHDLLELTKVDGELTPVLDRLAHRLANILAAICDLIDPSLVVLGGNARIVNKAMLDAIGRYLDESTINVPGREIPVRPAALLEHGVAQGAAFVALEQALLGEDGVVAQGLAEM